MSLNLKLSTLNTPILIFNIVPRKIVQPRNQPQQYPKEYPRFRPQSDRIRHAKDKVCKKTSTQSQYKGFFKDWVPEIK